MAVGGPGGLGDAAPPGGPEAPRRAARATTPLLVAVPNVSEGRDRATVAAVGEAYRVAGARVLDTHADPDHHRAVHTLAGSAGALADALVAGAEEVVRRIDLRTGRGLHPHVGALDVCPVVYLDAERRGAAILEALVVGDGVGRLGVPVLLYGELAGGRTRAELRRGGLEALTRRLADGTLRADFGPARPHPSAGAVLVAARRPLVAFNLELEGPATLEDARRIAALVREGGPEGLPGVRAIGLRLEHPAGLAGTGYRPDPVGDVDSGAGDVAVVEGAVEAAGARLAPGTGIAQVSCNVEDHRAVPLAALVAAVRRQAPVARCEVIGLPPAAAFAGFPGDVPVRGRRTLEDALRASG